MKTVGIIQARMGSTRLPGKILMDIGGKPMLERVVERVLRAERVDEVVVATSTLSGDDTVESLCVEKGWACFRGSESDVLDRYHQSAARHGADIVVRVTSDCPLLEPAVIDRVVEAVLEDEHADYASNVLEPRTFPRGLDVEAIRVAALARAWRESSAPIYREHVTTFLWQQPRLFELRGVRHEEDLSYLRWTVDTEEDLALVRAVYAACAPDEPNLSRALAAIASRPEIESLNAAVTQKPLSS